MKVWGHHTSKDKYLDSLKEEGAKDDPCVSFTFTSFPFITINQSLRSDIGKKKFS